MRGLEKAVASLVRDTAIESDAAELARLRKLTPHQQMDVGFVLRAATLEGKTSKPRRIKELEEVRSVEDALHFLRPHQ